jgi:hypothetical protein
VKPDTRTRVNETKTHWEPPVVSELDTRAEITAYSGDRDIPWISR